MKLTTKIIDKSIIITLAPAHSKINKRIARAISFLFQFKSVNFYILFNKERKKWACNKAYGSPWLGYDFCNCKFSDDFTKGFDMYFTDSLFDCLDIVNRERNG